HSQKGTTMRRSSARWLLLAGALAGVGLAPRPAEAAGCYFSAEEKDILQPGPKGVINWDQVGKGGAVNLQPKVEGNALDFGMVIPTPSKPKLDEMPRDFFKELAIYSILKKREQSQSKLLPRAVYKQARAGAPGGIGGGRGAGGEELRKLDVKV